MANVLPLFSFGSPHFIHVFSFFCPSWGRFGHEFRWHSGCCQNSEGFLLSLQLLPPMLRKEEDARHLCVPDHYMAFTAAL